jgi:hypothetical protein
MNVVKSELAAKTDSKVLLHHLPQLEHWRGYGGTSESLHREVF